MTEPFKIVCVISSLGSGGAERVLSTLANYWSRGGYEVSFITYLNSPDFFSLDNDIEYIRLGLSGGSMIKRLFNHIRRPILIRREINRLAPDVVISFIDVTNIIVLFSMLFSKIPVIISERTDPDKFKLKRFLELIRSRVYQMAYTIVVQNDGQKQWFDKMNQKVIKIENPAPIVSIKRETESQKKQLITAVGSLAHVKGFDNLIKAFAGIPEVHPNWMLQIIGEGAERDSLQCLIEEHNLAGNVELTGVKKDIYSEFMRSEFSVLSSRYEGQPNVLIESLACACPVISTDCSTAISELVIPDENGLIVQAESVEALGKAIKKLITNKQFREKMSSNAPASIKHLHIDKVLQYWDALFKDLDNNPKGLN